MNKKEQAILWSQLHNTQMDGVVARNRSSLDDFLSSLDVAEYLVTAGLTPDELTHIQARV